MKVKELSWKISLFFVILVGLAFVIALASLLVSSYNKANHSSIDTPRSDPPSELVVREHGKFFQYKYVIFEDKPTKTRIFYYHDAMIVLPPKTNGI